MPTPVSDSVRVSCRRFCSSQFFGCVLRESGSKPASLSTCLVVYIGALTRMARAIASLLRESITCIPLLSRIRSSAANTPVRELTYVNFQERHSNSSSMLAIRSWVSGRGVTTSCSLHSMDWASG